MQSYLLSNALVEILPSTECVTREQDPPYLRRVPPVRTRFYTLTGALNLILNRLALLGINGSRTEVEHESNLVGYPLEYSHVGSDTHYIWNLYPDLASWKVQPSAASYI